MVLIAVDDLLFSSRIREAARQLGVDYTFARTPSDIIQQARTLKPSLVIFDINSQKVDPIGTVAALKADPELKDIPTAGFVRHDSTELIAAARKAGIDQLMARSAFVANMPQILTGKESAN
jgi:PleD family two-component response regulator